ncbi:hypothetical protein ACIHIX_18445 [Streptomyces sp. NPDC051913]|uniref:hypothetical protein n=1 Tax=Streptomyces sp. NPDC051913 TaxID=3365676 RepID=UPI0037D84594
MTTTPDQLRVSEIARSLNRHEWAPVTAEAACGEAFFQLLRGLEEAKRPKFPREAGAGRWTMRLHTENVLVLAEQVFLLQKEFLPAWRSRLPSVSPMAELIGLYARGAQPAVRHAAAVRAAWESASLPEPASDDIARQVRYSGSSADEAAARLRYEIAARWENEPDRRSLWEAMEPVWNHLGAVRSTTLAAISGDVVY